jgi:ligand-binding sensor domain-containing protein/signal transduction histidine kinase
MTPVLLWQNIPAKVFASAWAGAVRFVLLAILLCINTLVLAVEQKVAVIGTSAGDFAYAEPYFENIGDNESIALGPISTFAQDAKGFLWIGTQFGLIRYDGYRFRKFAHDAANSNSLAGNSVSALWVGLDGRIWIGTRGDGLSVFDPRTELFKNYRSDATVPNALSSNTIFALVGDANGAIWVGTDKGLDYLAEGDLSEGAEGFIHYRHSLADPLSLASDSVNALLIDRQGALWVGSTALQRLRQDRGGFERIASAIADPSSLHKHRITALLEASDGQLWVGTWAVGAARLDPRTLQLHWVAPNLDGGEKNAPVLAIAQPQDGQIWLARFGAGVDIVSAENGLVLQRLRHNSAIPSSLVFDHVEALLRDRAGLLWVGTQQGLQRYDPKNRAIHLLHHSPSQPKSLSHQWILSVLELDEHRIAFGTGGNGIDVIDRRTGLVSAHRPDKPNSDKTNGLADGNISALAKTSDGALWAGTLRQGLYRLAAGAKNWQPYGETQGLPSMQIRIMLTKRDGELWVGTTFGLAYWQADLERFASIGTLNGLAADGRRVWAEALAEDVQGRLWIGGRNGLWVLEPGKKVLTGILHEPMRPDSLISDQIFGVMVDRKGQVWVTTDKGLERLRSWDGKTAEFDHINALFGRAGEEFGGGQMQDKLGRIWSDTIVLDPARMQAYPLSRADGLDIGNLTSGSCVQTHDGLFLFGGTLGLAIIEPELYQPSEFAPRVVATELSVDGKIVALGALEPKLVLTPQQRNFSVEFAALDYSAPKKLRYGYRMLGIDADWIDADFEHRTLSYGNLWPGEYTVQVRGSNRLGVWSTNQLNLKIQVLPAYWQTGWFLTLLLLALSGFIYAGYRWRVARLRAQARELQNLVNARTADILKLGSIGKELTATLDIEQAFERLYKQASARLDTYVFSIGIYDQAADVIHDQYLIEGGQRQSTKAISMDELDRPAVWCLRERRELITTCNAELLNFVGKILPVRSGGRMESIVYLPLIVEQRVISCLSVQSPKRSAYNQDQLEFLRVLASYTAIAISNSRAHGELAASHGALAAAHGELAAAHLSMQQTQRQLLVQEKMAGLGTLTAGVAHEINNPTNFAHVAAQNLQVDIAEFQKFTNELVDADEAPEVLQAFAERFAKLSGHINTMLHGTERIKTIVKDLRAFTRTDQAEKTTARMSECLNSTLNLVRGSWQDKVEFVTEFIDDPEIACWPALLNQVFMNLIVNGSQAIAAKTQRANDALGRLTITLQIKTSTSDLRCLHIDFSDTGVGMSEAVQSRILEPFFTTKTVGDGTGLGLSISYGIVLQHGGELQISSTPGEGSSFTVILPLPPDNNVKGAALEPAP